MIDPRLQPTTGRCFGGGVALLLSFSCTDKPALDLPITVRNHQDVSHQADGSLTPMYLLPESRPSLCLKPSATTDTSRWEMRLTLEGTPLDSESLPPVARMGPVLCFEGELPIDFSPLLQAKLCGRLFDLFEKTQYQLPCRQVDYRPDLRYEDFRAKRAKILQTVVASSLENFLLELDALARDIRPSFPLSAVQLELIATHFLREEGTPEARAEAARRLDALPKWLDSSEASGIAAEASREKALLEQRPGNPNGSPTRAWRHLAEADRRALAVAYPKRFMITVSQAEILARQGALDEAIARLRSALTDCRFAPCNPALLASAYGQLGWLIQFQNQASDAELAEAELAAQQAFDQIPAHVPLERINQLLNLALLQVRRGTDSGPALQRARVLLDQATLGGEMLRDRKAWVNLISGLAALSGGQYSVARHLCGELQPVSDLQIGALAASCEARAQRSLGDLDGADETFDHAIELHEAATSQQPGVGLPIGFGPQSEDFARAARVAVDRGRPALAWTRLARLDRLAMLERQRRRCRDQASDASTLELWEQIDHKSELIRGQLGQLRVSASPARREELTLTRRALVSELRELWRRWPACDVNPPPPHLPAAYRAVALEGEILLLRREPSGTISTVRRTPIRRRQLRRVIDTISDARGELDNSTWRRTLAPIAQALLPEDLEDLPAVIRYSLHGLLQRVPLAALPLPVDPRKSQKGTPQWLSDVTTPVVVPSGIGTLHREPARSSPPLFVVDPTGDLAGAADLVPFYRRLFPGAHFLTGSAATRASTRAALFTSGKWLHIDAHGRYHPGFPELSALRLWDDLITFAELAEMPIARRFVNLSGCNTGRWPITEDSGRFGVAGLLAQLGSTWVIASQGDLADRLARDFNRAFYQAVAAERPIPSAFTEGLAAVKQRHPASSWATLMLISGAQAELPASDAGRSSFSPPSRKP